MGDSREQKPDSEGDLEPTAALGLAGALARALPVVLGSASPTGTDSHVEQKGSGPPPVPPPPGLRQFYWWSREILVHGASGIRAFAYAVAVIVLAIGVACQLR
jgi:hypothetical protein